MPSERAASARRVLVEWGREVGNQPRLLLAAKAAVAAAIAWSLSPLLPFVSHEYAYYAPLGALISMHPTVARSARSGAEALAGLLFGILVGVGGFVLHQLGVPAVGAVGVVVAAGVIIGGLRVLGNGRDWVAITALFVLLIGGGSIEDYSLGYLIHIAFGIVVGVALNALVVPPLYLRRAERRLADLRDAVADLLHGLAETVSEPGPGREDLDRQLRLLSATADAVRSEVREGDESRRGNLRGRRVRATADRNDRRLRALERTVFFVDDLVDVLELHDEERWQSLDRELGYKLSTALHRTGDLVAMPVDAPDARERLARAESALEGLDEELDEHFDVRPSTLAEDMTIAMCLRRIVDACRPFIA